MEDRWRIDGGRRRRIDEDRWRKMRASESR